MIQSLIINQAKSVDIPQYLASLNMFPARQIGAQLVYHSPFTRERTPSFFVHPGKNVFNCFSSGEKGDVIRLVQLLSGCDFGEAINRLLSTAPGAATYTVPLYLPVCPDETGVQVLKVRSLENRALMEYVLSRGIGTQLASKYVKEMYFRVGGRNLFALAFANDNGGYELRNPFYKGCAITKAVTTIPGRNSQGAVNLFEGFFSYLSALQYHGLEQFRNDTVVLNSLLLLDTQYCEHLIGRFTAFHMFLDNNRPGWKKAIAFRNQLRQRQLGQRFKNCTSYYKGYSDFNAFLTGSRPTSESDQ